MDLLRARDGGVRSVYESFLWNVVDEGRAITVEISRLADLVPQYIIDPAKSRYKPILLDYNYFINCEHHDNILSMYQDLDDEIFADNKILFANLVNLFDSLASFLTTFKQYLEEASSDSRLEEWDTVRELELEAFYFIGLACLSLERLFTPPTLERLVVLLFRLLDDRSSGLVFALDFLHAPQNADDTLFSRVGVPISFVEEILEVFGDRFHEIQVHSSSLTRIRPTLPSLLFLSLRFRPQTLSNTPRLSRILDLFFRDQWVISVGGHIVNLVDEWCNQKLLSSLLSSRITAARARMLSEQQLAALQAVDLPQGSIRVSMIPSLVPLISKYNSALQWLCLHSYDRSSSRKSAALITAVRTCLAGHFEPHLAMATVARVEHNMITIYERALRTKKESLEAATATVCSLIDEIAEILKRTPNLPLKEERKTKLIEWFIVLKNRLQEEATGPKAAEIAMEVKQRVDHVISSVGLSLILAAVSPRLQQALDALHALSSLNKPDLRSVKATSAPTYAVEMLSGWSSHLQFMLVNSPLPLRALCYKLFLTVGVEAVSVHSQSRRSPLGRALSSRLSKGLRASLASLPDQIFEVIDTCILPQLEQRWPTALDKSEVRRLADIDDRLKLAEGTRALANLSLGVASLSSRAMGGRPREVVAEGLRRELRKRLQKMIGSDGNVHEAIGRAAHESSLLRAALVAACEHMRVPGSAIWRDEVASLFEKEAERIVDRAAKRKTWDDNWLDREGADRRERSLLKMMIDATNPKKTRYIGHEQTWRDAKNGKEVFTPAILSRLEVSLPLCTASMSRLLRARASISLRSLLNQMRPLLPSNEASPDALVRLSRSLPSSIGDELSSITQSLLLADYLDHARLRSARVMVPHVSRALEAAARFMDEESTSTPLLSLLPLLRHLGLSPSPLSTSSLSSPSSPTPLSPAAAFCIAIWLTEVGGVQTTLGTLPLPADTKTRLAKLRDTVVAGRYPTKHRPNPIAIQNTIDIV
ncbi:hypothetical protein PFISCL1PPCAC_19277 [Pristionchus fissidentatus]|uniref:Uncharacterized protein n=1 Tax=Pristionchus fissidentatus TaxID=1538716 RepID=A0AAV5W8B8_9BILA|nr:hypothetical protein PFISCL1PPCAC_19277 [Pristionchus fissidentatus]